MKYNRLGSSDKPSVWSRIKRIALTDVGALMRGLNADDLQNMERVLIEADFGVTATVELTQALEDEVRRGKLKTEADLKHSLQRRLADMLRADDNPGNIPHADPGPTIVLIVGVNGTGKTTTAAKLAWRLQQEGRKVLLAAADTARVPSLSSRSGPTGWAFPVLPALPVVIRPPWRSMQSMQPSPAASTR
jgi:signal recognition particle GTPase